MNTAVILKAAYQLGATDRKAGRPIHTKEKYLAINPWNYPNSLQSDRWYAYSSGYRNAGITPKQLATSVFGE
jgi:hypothetical protein